MITYLYKKTHNKTGMMYLGKTCSIDPNRYKGSGLYWIRHIKKHGYDVTTEILKECCNSRELVYWGKYYSELWNIVESKEWANMRVEDGNGGATFTGKTHSPETKQKLRAAHTGKIVSNETRQKISELKKGNSWGNHTEETKIKIRSYCHSEEFKIQLSQSRLGSGNPNYGKTISDETRKKISDAMKGKGLGKIVSPESREKMRLKAIAREERKRLSRSQED